MKHVMIDLETLGTAHDAAVISIGACTFDPDTGDIGSTYYERVDWQDAVKNRSIDVDTIKWWMRQADDARLEVIQDGLELDAVLETFADWLPSGCFVWGNGATFDITLLETLYRQYGLNIPWSFRNVRDMRTIKSLTYIDEGRIAYEGTAHNALDDAIWQAQYVSLAWQELKC